jgi:hypothetical protein
MMAKDRSIEAEAAERFGYESVEAMIAAFDDRKDRTDRKAIAKAHCFRERVRTLRARRLA